MYRQVATCTDRLLHVQTGCYMYKQVVTVIGPLHHTLPKVEERRLVSCDTYHGTVAATVSLFVVVGFGPRVLSVDQKGET